MTEEEGDLPSTRGGVEDTTARLSRTAFSMDGAVHRLAELLETFRNNLTMRSSAMHRVAITVGGAMFWLLAGLLLVMGILIGLDISERSAQRRQWDLNTAILQREWMRDTKAMNDRMDDLARKYRMAELKYDELNLTVRRAGIGVPDDDQTGVGGNLDPDAFGQPFLSKRRSK